VSITRSLPLPRDEAFETLHDAFDTATATAIIRSLEGHSRIVRRIVRRVLHMRGRHRSPLLPVVWLAVSACIGLSVHRLPGVGTAPSTELVAPVGRSLNAILA